LFAANIIDSTEIPKNKDYQPYIEEATPFDPTQKQSYDFKGD